MAIPGRSRTEQETRPIGRHRAPTATAPPPGDSHLSMSENTTGQQYRLTAGDYAATVTETGAGLRS